MPGKNSADEAPDKRKGAPSLAPLPFEEAVADLLKGEAREEGQGRLR